MKTKHTSAGIVPFNPFKYQTKALKAFRKHRFTIFRKCRQCAVEGSMVWGPYGPKAIETIQKDDLVYSLNLKTGLFEIVPVKRVYDNGEREVCNIVSKTGHVSQFTLDHEFLTWERGWIQAQNLNLGDTLVEISEPSRFSPPVHPSDPILLGYSVCDGSFSKGLYFCNSNDLYINEWSAAFADKFGFQPNMRTHKSGFKPDSLKHHRITGSAKRLIKDWLRDLGIYGLSKDAKQLPVAVFKWNNNDIATLISRMFAADGWYSGGHCNEAGIGLESTLLLNQIKQLLSRFGISSKIYPASNSTIQKLRIIGARDFNKFVSQIGIFDKNPRCPITEGFCKNRRSGEIKTVSSSLGARRVYDICVPPHNNYVVDGVVVHNSGVSKISGAFALWFAMFFNHKTVLIVSRRDEDAITFLSENVVFPFRHLPAWMQELWDPVKNNEHELQFPNGSKIKSLTSHPDVLRSNSSSLNIIDEAAFIRDMSVMWSAGYPCVRGDTLICTDNGLIEISKLGDPIGPQWQDKDFDVATDIGYQKCTAFCVSGRQQTIKITTYLGVELEGTGHHKIRVIDNNGDYVWRELSSTQQGDIVVSKPDQFVGKRRNLGDIDLTPQFAEILGLYIGDGSLNISRPKRFRIYFDPQDIDTCNLTIERFSALPLGLETNAYLVRDKTTVSLRLNSAIFIAFIQKHNLNTKTSAHDAEIPPIIMQSDREVVCAFLRGLFDSDGWCYESSTSTKLGFSTVSRKLASQVQILLSSIGIVSKKRKIENHTEDRFSDNPYYKVEIYDDYNKTKYREQIGFTTNRKQQNLDRITGCIEHSKLHHDILIAELMDEVIDKILAGGTFRGCADKRKWNFYRIRKSRWVRLGLVKELDSEFGLNCRLAVYLRDGLHFDTVVSVEDSECETYDLSVPSNHTYLINSVVGHNTLQHGGSVIIVSTTSGVGNWYWSTWTDAEAGLNDFYPIMINWWDMDWTITYKDALSGRKTSISPTAGIRKCATADEIDKYGPFWSPWLEEQYRALQERGEAWKFKQEILANFVGSGNSVVDPRVLTHLTTCIDDEFKTIKGEQPYVHPVKQHRLSINFLGDTGDPRPDEGLWVWRPPAYGSPQRAMGNRIVDPGTSAHRYTMGVDIATGKGRDYFGAEIFDVDEQEQVAELMVHTLPRQFKYMVDYLGRWYNNALMVVERNNGGDAFIDELRYDLMYPNLWRKKDINDKPSATAKQQKMQVAAYGFMTTLASKPKLNKLLIDYLRTDETGWKIYSRRLVKQLQIYVRKRDKAGRDTNKTEAEDGPGNFDDLVVSTGLAFIGIHDAIAMGSSGLIPFMPTAELRYAVPQEPSIEDKLGDLVATAGSADPAFLMPMTGVETVSPDLSAMAELQRFTQQIGATPIAQSLPSVSVKKHGFGKRWGSQHVL